MTDPAAPARPEIPLGERCVLPHRAEPDRPRRAADGLYVCRGCRSKLGRQLAQLGPLDRVLAARALASSGPRSGSRSAETSLPMNDVAATLRLRIRGFLSTWAGIVADERGFTPPDLRRPETTTGPRFETTRDGAVLRAGHVGVIDHLAYWLSRSNDWIAAHGAVDEYAEELHELHSAAFRVAYPDPPARFTVSPCPFLLWSDVTTHVTHRCDGALVVAFRPGEDPLPDAQCRTCEWTLDPRHWLALADKHRHLTAVELSVVWDVPLKTVERWARLDAWPHDDGRPRRYLASAAQETHDRVRLQQVAG